MLQTISCKHCKKKFPADWFMVNPQTRECSACEIFGPQMPGPGYNLRLKRKEPVNGQEIRGETWGAISSYRIC